MDITFSFETDEVVKKRICKDVLNDLPLWFGIPESNIEYCEGIKGKVFIRVKANNIDIGFASLKQNNKYCLEIYVMGILNKFHKNGIGTALISEIIEYAKMNDYKYLEVKTLDESRESEEYRKTRLFYKKVGFIPLDVLENEWGNDNPCLIMIMSI